MKARVKETGEIVEVDLPFISASKEIVYDRVGSVQVYAQDELDFDVQGENIIDYWEKLKHQYAGMAMQSYVSNNVYLREIREMCKEPQEMRDLIADLSILLATSLVQKLKKK